MGVRSAVGWMVCAAYVVGVFVAGLLPTDELPMPRSMLSQDKLVHALVFAGLALLIWFATGRRRPLLSFVSAAALGGLLELAQLLVSYRSADWKDFVADGVGALIVMLVAVRAGRHGNGALAT